MSETNSHVRENVETCLKVFPVLAALILITVWVHQSHLPYKIQIVIELVKTVIVIGYFTHLIAKRVEINNVWWMTIITVAGLLLLPLLNSMNHITGTIDTSKELQAQALVSTTAAGHEPENLKNVH
jgi:hypothetical protein